MKNVADIYPLSPVQLGMLFHTLANPQTGVYVNQYTCQLSGRVQPEFLQQAWRRTVARHPVLRTAFLWEGLEQPLQIVRRQVDLPWRQHDWRQVSAAQQTTQLADFLQRDRTQGFDLAQAPVLRLTLIRLKNDTYQLIWSSHHLLFDGWSLPLIWQDMLAYYAALLQGDLPQLPPAPPYRDYIAWRQAQDFTVAASFWRSQLQAFSEPTPLPAARTGVGASTQPYRQQVKSLSTLLTPSLITLARTHRLTLNTLIQGAWALLLSHYGGGDQVTYGSVVSGRPTELGSVETRVGLFINTLPVCVPVKPEQSLIPWLQDRQQQLLDLRHYEATPLADIQRWSGLPAGAPLFETIVVFENYPTATAPNLDFEIGDVRYLEQSNYPLALLVVPNPSLELILLYDPGRFEEAAIARLLNHLELLLTAFVEHPQAELADLPRLTPADRQQLASWQPTDYPRDQTIHQLIEAQVEQTPHAPAVIFEGQSLTYIELNQRANQLAQDLRSHGVAPGGRVALCLHPSLDRVISILAVLKTGAAYIPLDPTYPTTRLNGCLQDANPQCLLTHRSVNLPSPPIPPLYLDQALPTSPTPLSPSPSSPLSPSPPFPPSHPEDLAYIIYTSGSTGQPKGVRVSHRNLVHSTTARMQVYPDPVRRFLLLSSIAFDSAVAGLFWPLCQGGALVLPPARIEQDLQQLAALIAQQQITHTLCVPTLYNLLLEAADPHQLATLRTIIVAGEACPRTLAQHHHAKLPNTNLYNEYGPTEATVWSTVYPIPANLPPGPIPIGRPIPNTQIQLLDPTLNPVPIGAIGEIYISGDGITQGYLNQPERTAEAFLPSAISRQQKSKIQNPKSKTTLPRFLAPSPRLYKTGDLARYRVDGNLEWLGRCDRQVKIHGYRIELGEIEDVLRQHEEVREAVVTARPIPQSMPPSQDSAPQDSAPQDSAPQDSAPQDNAPQDSAPQDSVESLAAALAALDPEQAAGLLTAVEEGL